MPISTPFARGISCFPSLLPSLPTKPLPLVTRYPGLGRQFSRRYAMSTTLQSHKEPLSLGTRLKGDSGRIYRIEDVLTDRRKPLLCVYRARYRSFKEHSAFVVLVLNCRTAESSDEESYVIKNMIPGEFEYQLNLQKQLSACPNVRLVVDTVPDLDLFIYPFLTGDLLRLSQTPLPRETKIYILQCALHGLADMHEKGVLWEASPQMSFLSQY